MCVNEPDWIAGDTQTPWFLWISVVKLQFESEQLYMSNVFTMNISKNTWMREERHLQVDKTFGGSIVKFPHPRALMRA
jgi:hypothetical protein